MAQTRRAIVAAGLLMVAGCGGSSLHLTDVPQLYGVDADSGTVARLTHGEGSVNDVAWSPDGARLVYVVHGDLFTVRRDGSDRRSVLRLGGSGADKVAWSPDGTRVAYAAQSGVGVASLAPNGRGGLVDKYSTDRAAESPSWSPDGSLLAYSQPQGVYVAQPGRFRHHSLVGNGVAPRWSPDGRSLLVDDDGDLVLIKGGSYKRRVIASAVAPGAAWSPDARRVGYAAAAGPGTLGEHHLYVVSNAGKPRQVAGDDVARGVTWSPDGARLAYADYNGTVWTIRTNGSDRHKVRTFSGAEIEKLAWSPSSDEIAVIARKKPASD
jgi:Tol biopolymer transport system component